MLIAAAVMILMAMIQIPSLVKRREWKELAVFCSIWLFATVYALLISGRAPLPTTTEVIVSIIEQIFPGQLPQL